MNLIFQGAVIYVFLFAVMRLSGKRQFSELTAFDAVLLLIISETTQNALIGSEDYSLTAAILLITTLVVIDIGLSMAKQHVSALDAAMEGTPVVLVKDGRILEENARKERVDEDDVLAAARETQGLMTLDEIRFAILERGGHISVIPR